MDFKNAFEWADMDWDAMFGRGDNINPRPEKDKSPKMIKMGELERDASGNYYATQS